MGAEVGEGIPPPVPPALSGCRRGPLSPNRRHMRTRRGARGPMELENVAPNVPVLQRHEQVLEQRPVLGHGGHGRQEVAVIEIAPIEPQQAFDRVLRQRPPVVPAGRRRATGGSSPWGTARLSTDGGCQVSNGVCRWIDED